MSCFNMFSNCRRVSQFGLKGLTLTAIITLNLIARCQAQGTIAFNNLANNDSSMAAQSGGLVHIFTPIPPSGGSWGLLNEDMNFELETSPTADFNSLQPVHTWLISNGSALGIAVGGGHFADPNGGSYAIPGVSPGSAAFIRITAWPGNYNSLPAAIAAGSFPFGDIAFWNPTGGGGTAASSLVGMPAFNMPGVPEPAPLALLLAGAGALLLWHRRRV